MAEENRNDQRYTRAGIAWIWASVAVSSVAAVLTFAISTTARAPTLAEWLMLPVTIPLLTCLFLAGVLLVTPIPAFLLITLARALRLPRGLADVGGGALTGGLLIQLFSLPILSRSDWAILTLIVTGLGALGGLVYWHAAGRPRAPEVTI